MVSAFWQDRDTGTMEKGSSSDCKRVVVKVAHDPSDEQTFSQNRWTDHTLLHIFANCGISKLG